MSLIYRRPPVSPFAPSVRLSTLKRLTNWRVPFSNQQPAVSILIQWSRSQGRWWLSRARSTAQRPRSGCVLRCCVQYIYTVPSATQYNSDNKTNYHSPIIPPLRGLRAFVQPPSSSLVGELRPQENATATNSALPQPPYVKPAMVALSQQTSPCVTGKEPITNPTW